MDKIALNLQKKYWNKQHEIYTLDTIKVDSWLEQFRDVIEKSETPIIDLGCGSGNDVKILRGWNKSVIACDYAENSVANIRKNFPEVEGKCFDMTDGLPFEDNITDIVIADLSLHYFDEETTFRILNEIRRILKPEGVLLFRVNSMNDTHYGAGVGEEVEPHYYFTGKSSYKRFFDEQDVRYFFKDWNITWLEETSLLRYEYPKRVWTGKVVSK